MGDTVYFTPVVGLPARQATVVSIQYAGQPANKRLMTVRWKDVSKLVISLDNGRVVSGSEIEPYKKPHYSYPEPERCN